MRVFCSLAAHWDRLEAKQIGRFPLLSQFLLFSLIITKKSIVGAKGEDCVPLVSKDPCVGFAFCQQQFFSVRLSESQDCIGPLERKVVREARACVNPLFRNKKRLHHVFSGVV